MLGRAQEIGNLNNFRHEQIKRNTRVIRCHRHFIMEIKDGGKVKY